jgi:hypothetical protein
MKHSTKIGITTLTVMLAAAACSAEVPNADTVAAESAELAVSPKETSSSSATLDDDSSEKVGTATQALKACSVTCSVTKVAGSAECPSTIYGDGTAGFLGSYTRACRRARGDAAAKLPAGCVIGGCSESRD